MKIKMDKQAVLDRLEANLQLALKIDADAPNRLAREKAEAIAEFRKVLRKVLELDYDAVFKIYGGGYYFCLGNVSKSTPQAPLLRRLIKEVGLDSQTEYLIDTGGRDKTKQDLLAAGIFWEAEPERTQQAYESDDE